MKTLSACFVASAAALAAWGLSAAPAAAQASPVIGIACPVDVARRTITNDLPRGWWTTPIIDQLSATRVAQVGGRLALVCIYGASGAIQRYAPDGAVCAAVPRGFQCRAAARMGGGAMAGANPRVFRAGRVLLSQNTALDLDRGVVGDAGSADLLLESQSRSLFLTPRNGAKFWIGDGSERSYAACAQAPLSAERIPLSRVPVGGSICMRTNEGRIGRFRVEAVSTTTPPSVSIAFAAWTN